MLAEYTGVPVILAAATLFATGILLLHWLAGRSRFLHIAALALELGGK